METTEKIKRHCADNGIKQTELAKLSGISFGTINRIMNGKQELKPNTLKKIADGLGLSVIDLMDDDTSATIESEVCGYIEYDGEIRKIKSLTQLKKLVEQIQFEQKELPKVARQIISENKKNKKQVDKSNADFDFNLSWDCIQEYDATKLEIYAFKTANDTKDGITLDLGNQCSGYPFTMCGKTFHTSESAYLCGQFSDTPSQELISIQNQLLYEKNGYTAKKKVKNQNKHFIRPDWLEIMADWMLYVIWQKCQNKDFADKLRSIPRNAVIIENSTTVHEKTNVYWGSINNDIEDAREKVSRYVELQNKTKKKDELAEEMQTARNEIQYIGKYCNGHNLMGKILKLCQIALLDGTQPPINYDLLNEKKIYLFGELQKFGEDR